MKPIKFKPTEIKTIQFAELQPPTDLKKQKVKTELRLGFDLNTRTIAVFAKFSFLEDEKLTLLLEVMCAYQVKRTSWEENILDGEIVFPATILRHFAMLTVGTARGILHVRAEQTAHNRTILPTINLQKMIQDELRIKLPINEK